MVPLLVEQVRDRRSEADVQVTTDVRSAYAGRRVPTGHPQEVGLPFQQSLSLGLSKSVGRYRCFLRLSDCPRVAASLNPR